MARMPFSLFLALRYLKPKRTFVSIISLISMIGVTLGVMVLIVVIAVMTGFGRDLRDRVLGMKSHIMVFGRESVPLSQETIEIIRKTPKVVALTPYIQGPVLMKFHGRPFAPQIYGMDEKMGAKVNKLSQYMVAGKLDLVGSRVVIGSELAALYGITVGDRLTIYSPKSLSKKGEILLPEEATVIGVFESGMYEFDLNIVFTSLELAQELFDIPGRVFGYSVMTEDPDRAGEVRDALNKQLPDTLNAHTWMQLNRPIFSALAVEKNMMFFLLIFIDIVAAFGVMSTLITFVVQKTREIGVMKAIGAPPRRILEVFVLQGIIIGAIGTLAGLCSGLLLVRFRNEFLEFLRKTTGFEFFPREIYNFPSLPAQIVGSDLMVICLASLILCTLAGLIPAFFGSRLSPVEAMTRE
jgi:lipoprotein-releasing system permease protein